MSRLVKAEISGGALAADNKSPVKDYLERVAKYVPSEVLAAYLTLLGVIAKAPMPRKLWLDLLSFVVGLVVTPVYLSKMADQGEPKRKHLIIASIAFVVWAYSLKGIFDDIHWYEEITASVLLILFSLISGAFYPSVSAVPPASVPPAATAAEPKG